MQACRRSGVLVFPWIMDFYDDIDRFDDTCPHVLQEYLDAFGPHYLRDILNRYWMGRELSPEDYPLIDVLHSEGIGDFLDLAQRVYGYAPHGGFVNKCHLCLDIRRFLVMRMGLASPELAPRSFYHEV